MWLSLPWSLIPLRLTAVTLRVPGARTLFALRTLVVCLT